MIHCTLSIYINGAILETERKSHVKNCTLLLMFGLQPKIYLTLRSINVFNGAFLKASSASLSETVVVKCVLMNEAAEKH